ncbi:MAG TPA: putative ABC exporter domain-containing protein, partial [Gemmataceae bacterium]|nr:putative ABC exporter domain-containing protein [Gemmataceae bacterium]
MNRALWLLLWFRLKGWLRRLLRNAHTVRGLLLLVAGVLFFGCIFLNPVVMLFLDPVGPGRAEALEHMRTFGALGLLSYCALTLLMSSGERAITFSPAEVNFLFSGPFTRRQLLGYKITSSALACLVTSAFMLLILLPYGVWPPAAYVGLVLTLLFLAFFGMAISMLANTLGARAYNRRRKWLLAGLLLLVLLAVALEGRDLLRLPPGQMLQRLQASPVAQAVLIPLGWFVWAYTAQDAGGLLRYGGLALAVDAAMLGLVLALDVQYLEASAAASERVYARLQR